MGTLVRLPDPVPGLVAGLRDRCGLDVAPGLAAAGLRAEIVYYRAHMQRGCDASGLAALHRDCAAVLRDALGMEGDLDEITAALLDALRFRPFADAPGALARARRAGHRVIVVSNWDVSLAGVLERVGLAPLIDRRRHLGGGRCPQARSGHLHAGDRTRGRPPVGVPARR